MKATIALLVGTLVLGAVLVGCQGSGDSTPAAAPSRDPVLQQSLTSLQEHLGFMPVAPSVLPDGISPLPLPSTGSVGGRPVAYLIYAPLTSFGAATEPVLRAFALSETQDQAPVACPADVQSPGPRYECHELSIKDQPAFAETVQTASDGVTYSLNLRVGNVYATLDFRWQFPGDAPAVLPKDLQDIALRTAESLQ